MDKIFKVLNDFIEAVKSEHTAEPYIIAARKGLYKYKTIKKNLYC